MEGDIGVWLLGGIEIRQPAGPVPVSGEKLQALVALLALATPHAVSSGRLIDELWGEDLPAHPTNALQAQVSQLRRVLGREAVPRRGQGYVLDVDPDAVDSVRLERLVGRARTAAKAGDHVLAAAQYEAALSLARGPALVELGDYRFARQAASRLEEVVLAAHEGLADARLATGRHGEAVAALSDLVGAHPLRERFHAQLIVALYRSGRQAEALTAYHDARNALVEEFGVEPGPELQALEQAVLAQDPALDAVAVVAVAPAGIDGSPAPPSTAATPAAPAPGSIRPAAHGRLPLVGRDTELDSLLGDLEEVLTGRGRIALLGGEPGIGKTRLAEELTASATAQGATVVWGRCYEGRGAPAFWPWTQVVNGVLARLDDAEGRAALGSAAADVAQIAPEVGELVADLPVLTPLDPEAARFRLYQAVSAFVRRVATRAPLVIVIDDLHWADEASLQLVAFLAVEMSAAPVFVIATYRNVDPTMGDPLADTLVELSRRSVVRRLDLVGLDRGGLARFLTASGTDPTDELLNTVHRRTQGNPFFVTEILRLLPPDDDLHPGAVARVVPAGVKGVIRQRVARLPGDTRHVLTAASVLGQDIDLAALAGIVDLDGASVLEHLEPAIRAGILTDGPAGTTRYRFSHGLVNETVYDDLGAAQRARLHQRAAETLEARHGDADGPHLIPLAAHWFHAVPAVPPDKGVHYALRAARWAEAHVAHQQAEDQLEAALELLAGVPDGRYRAERELEVQEQLSVLLIVTNGYSAPGVERACARMSVLCRAIDEPGLLIPALWRLALYYLVNTDFDTAVATGQQILDHGDAHDDPGALLVGHMAMGTILTHRGDAAVARRYLDEALRLCDAGHDRAVAGFVTETPAVLIRAFSAWNWWLMGDEDRAIRSVADAVADAEAESYALTYALNFGSLVSVLRQDAVACRRYAERGLALARAGGYGMLTPFLTSDLGWAKTAEGDVEGGWADVVAGGAALAAVGARFFRDWFPAVLASISLTIERFTDALEWADKGLAEVDSSGERWFEAELHRLRGEALAGIDPADPNAAAAVRQAIAIAAAQGALALQRRAEVSLARLTAT